jgi:HPt (histidine-containing phosphotransfer) domain-containing protein
MNLHPGTPRVLDPDALRDLRALEEPGQASLLAEIVDIFRASSECDLTRLKRAVEAADHATVLNAAHRIRGAAAALGADQVRSIAEALELRGREQSLADANELLVDLETARERALGALTEELARSQAEVGT